MPEPTTCEEALALTENNVRRYAARWVHMFPDVPREDIHQAMRLGTVEAWGKLDPEFKNKFITYAAWYWKKHVREVVQTHIGFGILKISQGKLRYAGVMHSSAISDQGTARCGNRAGAGAGAEVAEAVSDFMEWFVVAPPVRALKERHPRVWDEATRCLTDKEKEVILLLYKNGLKTVEIAALKKCSVNNIQSLRRRAMEKMRKDVCVEQLAREVLS